MVGGLAGGVRVVVTGKAAAAHLGVVKMGDRPRGGDMTVLADVAGLQVIGGLAGPHGVVVAGHAAGCRRAMIEMHRRPGR